MFNKWLGVTACTTMIVGALLALAVVSKDSALAAQNDSAVRMRQRAALTHGGLREAAAVSGSFVDERRYPQIGDPASLDELSDLANLVFVGVPVSNICLPTKDGQSIVTLYSVMLERPLKGTARTGDVVTVLVIGGKVGFPDGSWAQVNTPGLLRPRGTGRYVWFVRHDSTPFVEGEPGLDREGPVYGLTKGPLGLYDITGELGPYVRPSGNLGSDLARYLLRERLSPDSFVTRVAEAVR